MGPSAGRRETPAGGPGRFVYRGSMDDDASPRMHKSMVTHKFEGTTEGFGEALREAEAAFDRVRGQNPDAYVSLVFLEREKGDENALLPANRRSGYSYKMHISVPGHYV